MKVEPTLSTWNLSFTRMLNMLIFRRKKWKGYACLIFISVFEQHVSSVASWNSKRLWVLQRCVVLWETLYDRHFSICVKGRWRPDFSLWSQCVLSDSALEGKCALQSFGRQPGLPAALLDVGLSLTDQGMSSAKCLQKYPTVPWPCYAHSLLIWLHTDSLGARVGMYAHRYHRMNLRVLSHIKYLVRLYQSSLDSCPQVCTKAFDTKCLLEAVSVQTQSNLTLLREEPSASTLKESSIAGRKSQPFSFSFRKGTKWNPFRN